MVQFIYVAHLTLVAVYGIIYTIAFIRFLLGHGDEVLDEQKELRLRSRR